MNKLIQKGMDPKVAFSIKDKMTSLQNRTQMKVDDIEDAVLYIKKKYKIGTEDALRKLINCAIDKKLVFQKRQFMTKDCVATWNELQNLKEL